MNWCFRYIFTLISSTKISFPGKEHILRDTEEEYVAICTADNSESISATDSLALKGERYTSESEAFQASKRWRDWLTLGLIHEHIGADFGDRQNSGGFNENGLSRVTLATNRTALNGNQSLHIYEKENNPVFVKLSASGFARKNAESIEEKIGSAAASGKILSDRASLAYELYSIAQSTPSADARFVILTTALEAFINEQPLSKETQDFAKWAASQVKDSEIPENEKGSVEGRIRAIKKESITQAGRRISKVLDKEGFSYGGKSTEKFFNECYAIRSNIVHANHPREDISKINEALPHLANFVRDLILRDPS